MRKNAHRVHVSSSGEALPRELFERLTGRDRWWWLMRDGRFVGLGNSVPSCTPVSLHMMAVPGKYILGCGDKKHGVRVHFTVTVRGEVEYL